MAKKRQTTRQKTEAREISRPGSWWRPALLVLACAACYANSLSGPFILDDVPVTIGNPTIREWWRLGRVLFPKPDSSVAGRPLANVSIAINYALGGFAVGGYHVWNIVVHACCALMLFGIIKRTLDLPTVVRLRPPETNRYLTPANLAFSIALIWAVHPLNTEAVDYVVQRTESMSALFYLLGLYAAIRLLAATRAAFWSAMAVLSAAAGVATKESVATLPLVIVLYDRAFQFESFAEAFRHRWRLYAGLAATWVLLALLMASAPRAEVAGFSTGLSPWTYLLNQAVVITHYVRLAFWPRGLVAFYGWPAPLTLLDVLPYFAFVSLLAAATLLAWFWKPAIAFLGAWFFVTLAPSSSIIPVATEVGAERRMYLPLMAVVALTVLASERVWVRVRSESAVSRGWTRPIGGALLAVVVVALAIGTISRNRDYASAVALAQTVVERRPSSVAHHILGVQLMEAGRHDEAERELRLAVDGDSQAQLDLGIELYNKGRMAEAAQHLEAFLATWHLPYRLVPHWLEPSTAQVVTARTLLGRAYLAQQDWSHAIAQFEAVLAIAPSDLNALKLLADALWGRQSFDEAARRYRAYLKTRPADVDALNRLGISLIGTEKLDEAIDTFKQAAAADPKNAQAERNLAMALLDRRDVVEAVPHAARAVALSPNDPVARDLYGRALAIEGKLNEAREQFEAALRINPSFTGAREHLGRLSGR